MAWRNNDIFPGEWVGTEHELELEKELNVGDRAKVIVDSQFDDNAIRRIETIGTVVSIKTVDEWCYKLDFGNGFNWFKRYHLQKISDDK